MKGFTLIELILVVAIVAVLAGVMIPKIQSARQEARIARLLQLANALRHACMEFHSDTGIYGSEDRVIPELSQGWAFPRGWDGPYLDRRLSDEKIFSGVSMGVFGNMGPAGFDFDGDGSLDKNPGIGGNILCLYSVGESIAKGINDQVDINVPGDWKNTGKVIYVPAPVNWLTMYLLGGS